MTRVVLVYASVPHTVDICIWEMIWMQTLFTQERCVESAYLVWLLRSVGILEWWFSVTLLRPELGGGKKSSWMLRQLALGNPQWCSVLTLECSILQHPAFIEWLVSLVFGIVDYGVYIISFFFFFFLNKGIYFPVKINISASKERCHGKYA